jgi:pyridoxal phosphate enzyme (YggS family)
VKENLSAVSAKISAACAQAGRSSNDVTVIWVTKGQPISSIVAAQTLGAKHIGENRVEEALLKKSLLAASVSDPLVWHMIGRLQTRKAQKIAEVFDWVQSVDSVRIAQRLDHFAGLIGKKLHTLLQVNIADEASKAGFRVSEAEEQFFHDVEKILSLPNLRVEGLMTIAPEVENPEDARRVFRHLRDLRNTLRQQFSQSDWHHLSMGMTNDYSVAIEEGATMTRIGRGLFGTPQHS